MTDLGAKPLLLNQFIPYRMVNLANRISDSCATIYQHKFGISIPEWRILARLGESGSQNSSDLARLTLMDKSKVSRAVKALDEKGYLLKKRDVSDNRATFLSLSEQGQSLYHQIAPDALDWEGKLLTALEVAEYGDLMRIISKLDRQLDHFDSSVE